MNIGLIIDLNQIALFLQSTYLHSGIPHNINGSCHESQGHIMVKKKAIDARVLPGRAGLAVQDRVLPDEDTITSRCLTGAWEQELDIVSTDVVPLLKSALQVNFVYN